MLTFSRRQFMKLTSALAVDYLCEPLLSALNDMLESRAVLDEGLNWVTKSSADHLLKRIKKAGFNVFIPCVWHGRGAVWPSDLAPWDSHHKRLPGFDPLENLIKQAERYEIEVHPWFTVALRQREFLQEFYDRGTPQESFDVHREAFREFISSLILEVVSRYPVHGINLDYVRATGICNSAHCVEDYQRYTGRNLLIDGEIRRLPGTEMKELIRWQEEAVRDIVRRVSEKAREVNENIVISIDAAPGVRSVEIEGQNSMKWADDGLIDVIYCMDYRISPDFAGLGKLQSKMKRPEAMVLLCGNYDVVEPSKRVIPRSAARVSELLNKSRSIGRANGVALYLYSMLSDAQIDLLQKDAFKMPAKPKWVRANSPMISKR